LLDSWTSLLLFELIQVIDVPGREKKSQESLHFGLRASEYEGAVVVVLKLKREKTQPRRYPNKNMVRNGQEHEHYIGKRLARNYYASGLDSELGPERCNIGSELIINRHARKALIQMNVIDTVPIVGNCCDESQPAGK
jgi:hypothetical protein